jgi:hypothetical protein
MAKGLDIIVTMKTRTEQNPNPNMVAATMFIPNGARPRVEDD